MPSIDALRAAAAEQAARLQSEFIGTEHLFLAWLTWARGPIADAVSAAGLNADSFQEVLTKGSKRGRGRRGGPAPGDSGTLTSHALRVLEMATERGRAAGREEPGTDDLILAMVQEPRGAIARALTEFDIKPSRLKALASDRPARGGKGAAVSRQAAPAAAPTAPVAPTAPATPPQKQQRGRGTAPAASRQQAAAPPPHQPREAAREVTEAPEPRRRPALDLGTRHRFGLLSPLYLAVPVALVLHFTGGSAQWVALAAAVGAIPMAALLGEGTEQLVARSAPLTAAFVASILGNAAMLAFAVAALRHGQVELALVSVAGSLLASITLILGLGLLGAGGRRGPSPPTPHGSAALLAAAVALVLLPTVVENGVVGGASGRGLLLPQTFAVVMVATLFVSLGLIWRSDRPIFGGMQWSGDAPSGVWSTGNAAARALLGLVGVVAMAELVLGRLDASGATAVLSPVFLGMILLPLLGSVPQQGVAVTAASRGHRDLAFHQVSAAVTLLVLAAVPALVGVAVLLGVDGFDLVFSPFQALLLVGGVLVAGAVMRERESSGIDGALLVAGYLMAAVVAWFI